MGDEMIPLSMRSQGSCGSSIYVMTEKRAKSNTSLKSVRSMKTMSTSEKKDSSLGRILLVDEDNDDGFKNFVSYLPSLCERYSCPRLVRVKKNLQRPLELFKPVQLDARRKSKRISFVRPYDAVNIEPPEMNKADVKLPVDDATSESSINIDSSVITITAMYDVMNRLAEIMLQKVDEVPRVLMQVIGLLAPKYQQLTKITIRKCTIDKYTVYELCKMLPLSWITDICLDYSPVPELNYAILLDNSRLRSLSLCNCQINDEACRLISLKLPFLQPAEKSLYVLNLSSNHITDLGAKYLSSALRSNRRLRYLNLADNRINDEGAICIFNVLTEFMLTYEEVMDKRHRYSNYLRERQILRMKYINEYETRSVDENSRASRKTMISKPKSTPSLKSRTNSKKENIILGKSPKNYDDFIFDRADMLAGEMMGPFTDPYSRNSTILKNGYSFCRGNFCLCYLNLSYNNLSQVCMKKLASVLLNQETTKNLTQNGLYKVVLDGNYIPDTSEEMITVNKLLNKKVMARSRLFSEMSGRRKSKTFK